MKSDSFFDTPFAKINLCLHLTGKRPDGYNNLFTVFYRINLKDELLLVPHPSRFTLVCDRFDIPEQNNLITQAYEKLRQKTNFKKGVTVFLAKGIPVAAGLGGASSDAASFLRGMNALFKLGLSNQELWKMGSELGADVPFFLSGWSAAQGTGIGNILSKLSIPKDLWMILVTFPDGLSTKTVYQAFQYGSGGPSLTKLSHDVTMLSRNFKKRDFRVLSPFFKNDLQPVSMTMHRGIGCVLDEMQRLQVPVGWMSGSGPTVVGLTRSKQEALRLAQKLEQHLQFQGRVQVVSGI